ncbi:hypothetical protein [Bacteroides nordii]|uniref:hypothetical protein n=1 Tax=Bacteroides nordii TaxID=291645 RepID=UPI002040C454|nr:hypothetical protein [Bacteroides nordii]GFZ39348.1 hypothetical protein BANORC5_13830 [Bacteroides nordii]
MQALLTNIELDIQELKYLMEAFEREPNGTLREVLKRNILQMRDRLDQMLTELDTVQNPVERESIQPILTEKEIEETILEEVEEEKETLQVVEFQSQIEVQETIKNVSAGTILGERIRPVTDLRRSISLNDSFRFSRELFNGDSEQMNRAIEQISEMSSLDTAIAFLYSKVNVDEENEAMIDFQELLKKYFN